MALVKNVTLNSGINLPNAYIRVKRVDLYNGRQVEITVEIYKDKVARNGNKSAVAEFTHKCTDQYYDYFSCDILRVEGISVLMKSYDFIKENVAFYADAIDDYDLKE